MQNDGATAVEWIRAHHADALVSTGEYGGEHWAEVRPEAFVELCRDLKDNPETSYTLLVDVTAVHWPDHPQPMEMVYHLFSFDRNDRLRLKLRCGDEGPVPSVAGVWRAASWNERETYDMFGIRFDGHPDMRRILMPDDYTDFPLRKEFPLYRG